MVYEVSSFKYLRLFLWEHLKSLVYSLPVNNLERLKRHIKVSCDVIRNTEHIFQRTHSNMGRKAEAHTRDSY